MTSLEMQQLFETLLTTAHKEFDDTEKLDTDDIFRFLNESQILIVQQLYEVRNLKLLSNLLVSTIFNTPVLSNSIKRSYTIDFTGIEYDFYVNSRSSYYRDKSGSPSAIQYIYNEEISPLQATQFITTMFNEPYFKVPVCYTDDGKLRVIADAFTTITGISITYVRQPIYFNVDIPCEVNKAMHQTIVENAVKTFIEQKLSMRSQARRRPRA